MSSKVFKKILMSLVLLGSVSGCFSCGKLTSDDPVAPIDEKKLINLSSSGKLEKTKYIVGEKFDPTGLTFTATFSYSNNSTEEVDVTDSVTFEPEIMALDTKFVFAKYKFGTVVKACTISGISVENSQIEDEYKSIKYAGKLAKTQYNHGDLFDPTGLTFFAVTTDEREILIKTKNLIFNDNQPLVAGQTNVVAKYNEFTTDINGITVKNSLVNLSISGSLTKISYITGDTLDLTGLTITANFVDGTSKDVTNEVNLSTTSLTTGMTSVTASYTYEGITKTVTISGFTVTDVTLTDLRKTGTLIKTNYFVGDTFDPSGLTFTAYYSNGSSKNVTTSVGFNPSTMILGTTKVVASFTSGSISKTVDITGLTVSKVALTSLTYSGTLTTSCFKDGDTFDPSGLTFTANFNNGTSKDVTNQVTFNPTVISYNTSYVVASYTFEGTTKSVNIDINVDDPYQFEKAIDFNSGIVSLSSDGKTLTYKKESTSNLILTITSTPALSNACLDASNSFVVNRKNSLKFEKTAAGTTKFKLGKEFIDQIGNKKFTFDFFATVWINSNNVANLTDGNGKILNPSGMQYEGNRWYKFTFDKSQINNDGVFLITNGSSQGTYYLDNIRIVENDTFTDVGTIYLGKNDNIVIPVDTETKFATKVEVDNEPISENAYEVLENGIKLSNLSNGEHKLSFTKKTSSYSGIEHSYYFALYKAQSTAADSQTLSYGSDSYVSLSGYSNVNRVIHDGKSIAYEQSSSSILIPSSALIECLPENGGKKQSGTIKLFVISGEKNANCVEINETITLSGDATTKSSRTYTTDETYHTFGYSATGGGSKNDYLYSEDMFMDYKRSGLENVYDQLISIPDAAISEDSFKQGGNCDYIAKDFALCEKLGLKCYVIDYLMRNKISTYNKVKVWQNGTYLGIMTYGTIDDGKETTFYNAVQAEFGLSSNKKITWERYQKPIYGEDGYYATYEDCVTDFYNHIKVYAKYGTLSKLVICDEPRYYNLEAVGVVYKATKEALKRAGREDIEVDTNLLPLAGGWGYDDGDHLGPKTDDISLFDSNYEKRVKIYNEYMRKFVAETGADYISYDLYPLYDDLGISGYNDTIHESAYANLLVAAEFAKANNLELHVVTQAYTAVTKNSNKNRRVMSPDDMRWLCNQLMGCGVTRVSFFTYYNRSYNSTEYRYDANDKNATVGSMKIEHFNENGVVDSIERTNAYYSIQGELQEMKEFSNVSLNFAYKASKFIKGSTINYKQEKSAATTGPVSWAQDVHTNSFVGSLTKVTADKEYCFTTSLQDKNGNYMYMIQNSCDPKFDSVQTATLTFASGVNYVVIYENGTKRVVNVSDNKVSIKLSPAHTAFVMPY